MAASSHSARLTGRDWRRIRPEEDRERRLIAEEGDSELIKDPCGAAVQPRGHCLAFGKPIVMFQSTSHYTSHRPDQPPRCTMPQDCRPATPRHPPVFNPAVQSKYTRSRTRTSPHCVLKRYTENSQVLSHPAGLSGRRRRRGRPASSLPQPGRIVLCKLVRRPLLKM